MKRLERPEGHVFLWSLAFLGALGHLHLQEGWWVRVPVAGLLLLSATVCVMRLLPIVWRVRGKRGTEPHRLALRASTWARPRLEWMAGEGGSTSTLTCLTFWAVLLVAGAFSVPRIGPGEFSRHGQFFSQASLWLLVVTVCLFWPAVFVERLQAPRANRRALALNVVILCVVLQAPLHAFRMYHFHDRQLVCAELFWSEVAFVIAVGVASLLGWWLTHDAVAAGQHRRSAREPRVVTDKATIGLALSGGGIRAAAVATGVLAALRTSEPVWKRLGFVSAVSGGSWALANFVRARFQPARALAAMRANRDYLRRGTSLEWVVRPLAVAIVGTVLQLASLGLALLLLIFVGLYLTELARSGETVVAGGLLLALQGVGVSLPLYAREPLGLARFDALLGVGALVAAVAGVLLVLGLLALLLSRTRLVSPRATERLDGFGVECVWKAGLLAVCVGVPTLIATSFASLVGVAIVAAIGLAYVREWRLPGLGAASIVSAIGGAIGWVSEKNDATRALRQTVDGLVRQGLAGLSGFALEASKAANDFVEFVADEPWPLNEQVGLGLLACIGLIGFAYFVLSLVVRLEAVGLGTVWRAWVSAFAPRPVGHALDWPPADERPVPIVNMAVNAPTERFKVAHFEADPERVGGPTVGWVAQQTPDHGLSLGDAIAVSSAALNSQAGRFVASWLRPLLSILSLKLGQWRPHPRVGDRVRPALALQYMNRELLGWNALADAHLFLSDGGHFENLGAYSLLLRGVPTIVVLDAAADPEWHFGDLSRFIELARFRHYELQNLSLATHLPGDADASGLRLPADVVSEGVLVRRQGVGRSIEAPDGRPATIRFIYAKLGLVPDLSPHTWTYARQHPEFPQESTLDQFFSEAQLEAYLELGQRIGARVKAVLEAAP